MAVRPVLHCNNIANVSVEAETDLAGLPVQTYPDGTTIWVRSTQVLFTWNSQSLATTVAGQSVAVATGGAWLAIASVATGLGPFTTIVQTTTGARLIDVSASQLAVLERGSRVWVESVKDFWRWDPSSTLTPDNITVCNPTANGANPGRFIRTLTPAPEWMFIYSTAGAAGATGLIIDGANSSGTASDENDGLTAATPLLTDLERQRRMGPVPVWTQQEYHIRYISDITYVRLDGYLLDTNVFLHGSMTNNQGQAVLYTGSITAIVAQNPATNTPYQITDGALPVSWTASALINGGTTNTRLRLTSGTVNAVGWPVFDQGARTARFTDFLIAGVYTTPFSNNNTAAVPANGNTFVVERLTQIRYFHNHLEARGIAGVGTATFGSLIVESLQVGMSGANAGVGVVGSNVTTIYDGCRVVPSGYASLGLGRGSFNMRGSWLTATTVGTAAIALIPSAGFTTWSAGGSDQIILWNGTDGVAASSTMFRNNFMFQGGNLQVQKGYVNVTAMAVFDPPASNQFGIQVLNNAFIHFPNNAAFWGGGTVRAPTVSWFVNNRGCINYVNLTNVTLLGSSVDIQFDSFGTTCPAFDQAASAYTAPRTTSFANLVQTVALGGFGGSVMDPRGGSYVGVV